MIKIPSEKRVIKEIGSSQVVWFPESNRWVEFKEPAWFIYKMYEKDQDKNLISDQLAIRYDLPEKEADRFLEEVVEGIENAKRPLENHYPGISESEKYTRHEFKPYFTHHYLIKGQQVTVSYGTSLLEHYIHRPLAHLETKKERKGAAVFQVYELRDEEDKYILRYNVNRQQPDKIFEDPGILKHSLYTAITSHIYGIPEDEWMSFIHASAITNGREALLLSSSSGSGKSTMAALLQSQKSKEPHKEFFFMSDDFVPVDAYSRMAHVFPAALTVKEGSFDVVARLYKPQNDSDSDFMKTSRRQTRYLHPKFQQPDQYMPQPVRTIVFIKFDKNADFKMEKLPVTSALAIFHQEAWVSHNPRHARAFIDWFVTLDCYMLEYSDNYKAMKAISELFSS